MLMWRFVERDSIGVFTREWPTRSKTGNSVFRTYYMHFLLAYAPGKLRNLMRLKTRELTILDAPVSEDGATVRVDLYDDETRIDESVEFDLLVEQIRERATPDQRAVVDQLLGMAIGAGESTLTKAGVARDMGVSAAKADAILRQFRGLVSSVVGDSVSV